MAAKKRRKRTYGSGAIIPPRVPGGTWSVRLRVGGRRVQRGGIASRELAERYLAQLQANDSADELGLVRPASRRPLSDFAADFFDQRDRTHASAKTARGIWRKHLAPAFGRLPPGDIDGVLIRRYADAKRGEGLAPGTVRGHVALLSSLLTQLVEDGVARSNPAKGLPRATMRLMASTHDPRTTPFIEQLADVQRIYEALPEPLDVAYAIGALAGLRTGEVFGLRWRSVDLPARRIHVHEQRGKSHTKDREGRMVPILDGLLPVLEAWKSKSAGELVIPSMRIDGEAISRHTPGRHIARVLAELGLERPGLGWYEATRHTFASQWVMAGGSIEQLREILGHYSVVMTERYAHLRPELFPARELARIPLTLQVGRTLAAESNPGGLSS